MSRTIRCFLLALVVSGLASSAFAQTSYTSNAATGAWNTSRWNNSADAAPFTSAYTANNDVSFTSGTYSFAGMGATINVGNITVANGVTVTFTSAANTFATNGTVRTIDVGTGATIDFAGQSFSTTSGTGFIKNGAGVLALSGGGYNGGFTLNAGIVIARGVDAMGASATNVLTLNGGILASNATRSFSTAKFGGGIVIGGDVQFGAFTTVTSLASDTANLTFANNVSLGSSSRTLTLGNRGTVGFSGIISNTGSGGITFAAVSGAEHTAASAGRFEITGTANTFTGPISFTGSEVRFAGNGSFGDANNTLIIDGGRMATTGTTFELASTHAIQVSSSTSNGISSTSSGVLTYRGVISDKAGSTGTWAKIGGGTLELGGINTYSGTTVIQNGFLKLIDGNDRLPTGTTVNLGQTASANVGTLDLNGFNQQIAGLNSVTGTGVTGTNTVTSTASATLRFGGSGTYVFGDSADANKSGVIGGAIGINKTGSGAQTLGGNNSYTGGTTISGGTLTAANASALGSGNVTVSGGTLASTVANLTISSGALSITSGTINLNDTGIGSMTLGSAQPFTMSGGTWNLTLASTSSFDSIIGSGGATFAISGGTINLGGTIAAGTYNVLSGFAGGSTASGYTITGYDTGSFTASLTTGGDLVLTALSNTILYYTADGSTLGGNGNWSQTGGTNWSFSDTTVAGVAWDQTKAADFKGTAGTVTITTVGGVTANKGITFETDGYVITGQSITLGGATQAINTIAVTNGTATIASDLSAANGFTVGGGGTLVLGGTVTAGGAGVNVAGGSKLQIGAGSTTGALSGDVALGSASVLTFNRSDDLSYSGAISGTGGAVIKAGAGVLTLSGANSYGTGTGVGTSINGGTLSISAANNLGTATTAVAFDNGGTLKTTAALALTRNFVMTGTTNGNGGVDTNGFDSSTSGTLTGTGTFTKAGAGSFTFTSTITPGGSIDVAGGSLRVGAGTSTMNVATAITLSGGNLVLNSNIRFNVNAGGSVSGAGGQLQVTTNGTLISQASGDAGGAISAAIKLNSTNAAFTAGSWSGTTYTAASFTTTIGGTTGGGLTITGGISGDSDVDFSNNSGSGGGTGYVKLNAAASYTGNTLFSGNTPAGQAYSVQLGVDNALPTTTGLIGASRSNSGLPVLDLNGFNQTVAYLADGATASGSKYLTIRNDGATDSMLTVSGSATPGTASFRGIITDGTTNKIILVKGGTNTLTLTGANTYSGGTSVNGGTLVINNTTGSGTGSGDVAVNAGGTLAGTGTIAGGVNVIAGGALRGGTTTSPVAALNLAGATTLYGASGNGAKLFVDLNNATTSLAPVSTINLGATGTLNFDLTAGKFTIQLLNDPAALGLSGGTYQFVVATAADDAQYAVNGGAFPTQLVDGTDFSLVSLNNGINSASLFVATDGSHNLILQFTATPEPEHALLLASVVLGSLLWARRRYGRSTQGAHA